MQASASGGYFAAMEFARVFAKDFAGDFFRFSSGTMRETSFSSRTTAILAPISGKILRWTPLLFVFTLLSINIAHSTSTEDSANSLAPSQEYSETDPLKSSPKYAPKYSDARWGDWLEAKNLYDQKQYSQALAYLQAHPHESSSFYYNLGTVAYRMGLLGRAVAYLEKGNRIGSHDPDVQYNLSVVRLALTQQLGAEFLDPSSTWWEKLADRVTLEQARATLGLMGLILVLLWIRAYVTSASLRKTFLNSAALLGLFCFAITSAVYGIQRLAEGSPPAICLEKDSVRSGPGSQYMELARIEAGSKVRLLGSSVADTVTNPSASSGQSAQMALENNPEIWKQVRYSSDGVGWIRAASLLTL